MKRLALAALSAMAIGATHAGPPSNPSEPAGPSGSSQAEPDVTLEALLDPPSRATTGVNNLRSQMLTDAGRTVGFRGGMVSRGRSIIRALEARADQLDMLFQFAPLMSKNGTVPPVIVEAQDLAAFAPDQIRTATNVFSKVKDERFVSVPPTWRDYLLTGLPQKGAVELPVVAARPQDDREMTLWRRAVQAGWDEGQKQADAILEANFNRLTRDLGGMLLYATLLQRGMISGTRVAELSQTVSGDGGQMMLGDTLRRLTSKALFETRPEKWRPAITEKHPLASKTSAASDAAKPPPAAGTP